MKFDEPTPAPAMCRWHVLVTCAAVLCGLLACVLAGQVALGQHPDAQVEPSPQVDASPVQLHGDPADEVQDRDGRGTADGPRGGRRLRAGSEELPWKTVEEFFPEQAQRLKALKEKDPAAYGRWERRLRPLMRELRDAQDRDPRLARTMVQQHRTEMAIHEWRRRYHTASPQEQTALEAEGRELVRQRVELRLQRQRLEIELLERRLEGLKAGLHEREASKDRIVERETAHLKSGPASRPDEGRGTRGQGRGDNK